MSDVKRESRKGLGKRKRDGNAEEAPTAKKQETTRPEQTAYNEAIAAMNPSLISDYFAKSLKKFSPDSTAIELEEKYLPTRSILDTTSSSSPRVAKNLPEYLETFCGGKEELSKGQKASPHTLIITQSGIRTADLAREVRLFATKDVKVAKLFAKHMKLAEAAAFVGKNKISVAIGTPTRPRELIEQGNLKLDKLRRIVIDGSYIDDKKRSTFDMVEIFPALVELLNTDKVKKRLGAKKNPIEILVF